MNKILVIDDDRVCLALLCKILENQGYTCVPCSGSQKAIDSARDEDISLVVCDNSLGDSSGIEVFQKIKELRPLTRGILVSAHLNFERMIETVQAQFDDCLPKPIDATMLCQSVLRSVSMIVHWRERFHIMSGAESTSARRQAVTQRYLRAQDVESASAHILTQEEVDQLIQTHWKSPGSVVL